MPQPSGGGLQKRQKKKECGAAGGPPPHPDPAVGRQRVSYKCTTGLPGVALEQVSALVSSGAAFGENEALVNALCRYTGTKQRVLLSCRVLRQSWCTDQANTQCHLVGVSAACFVLSFFRLLTGFCSNSAIGNIKTAPNLSAVG